MNPKKRQSGRRIAGTAGITAAIMFLSGIAAGAALATEKPVAVKLVTLAPLGTSPHVAMLRMGEQWRKVSGGRVKLTVIGSYRAGGEAAIVDKMGVGGVDAALMTMVGLSKISPSVNALASIPMAFHSLDEVDYMEASLGPALAKHLEQKGYIMLFWADIGWVRFFSVQPLVHPQDLKKMKVFAWAGNAKQVEMMKNWGTSPVALEPADILPALSTGMIDHVTATPFSANAGQYASVAKNMLALNWAPLVGGAVIRKQTWEKIPVELRPALLEIAARTGRDATFAARQESDEAVEVMKRKQNLKVHIPSPQIIEEWRQSAQWFYPLIRGAMVPADMFDQVETTLQEYRRLQGGK